MRNEALEPFYLFSFFKKFNDQFSSFSTWYKPEVKSVAKSIYIALNETDESFKKSSKSAYYSSKEIIN